tara:strand:- start:768 stop:1586 length:819 start_codon:yes stop_codon:yes gene_type:complete
VEINTPAVKELTVRELGEINVIPPAIKIPETTLGDLPFGFVPVVELPCVVARDKNTGTSKEMFSNDPEGTYTLCDHKAATFVPYDFYKDLPKPKQPRIVNPSGDEREEVKEKDGKDNQKGNSNVGQNLGSLNSNNFNLEPLPCPPPDNQYPVGSLGKYGTARVKGFQVNLADGKCETLWEPLGKLEVLDNYAPPPALVTSTFTVALFGASAALFASPLTKLITKTLKPISKKLIKVVKAKLGKKDKVLSKAERMKAQREKTMVNRMWSSLRR